MDKVYYHQYYSIADLCCVVPDRMPQEAANGFRQMYDNQELCDFTIKTLDGVKFEVHKSYMVAVSDYFKVMLTGATCMVESRNSELDLQNVSSVALRPLLAYVYGCDKIDLTVDNIYEILNAAALFQLPKLVSRCGRYLHHTLNDENMLEVMKVAKLFSLDTLLQHVDNRITSLTHINVKSRLSRFGDGEYPLLNDLEVNDLERLIQLDCVQNNEQVRDVFNIAIRWLQVDLENRKQYTLQLLQHVKLPLMLPQQLDKIIKTYRFLSKIPEGKKLLDEARTYQDESIHKQVTMQSASTTVKTQESLVVLGSKGKLNSLDQLIILRSTELQPWTSIKIQPRLSFSCEVSVICVNNFMMVCDRDTRKCALFDPRTLKWEKLSSLPVGYQPSAVVANGSNVFAFGGKFRKKETDKIYHYSFGKDTWKCLVSSKLPAMSADVEACTFKQYIYVLGAQSQLFVRFDGETHEVKTLPQIPVAMPKTGIFTGNDSIYAVQDWYTPDACVFSVEDQNWSTVRSYNLPTNIPRLGDNQVGGEECQFHLGHGMIDGKQYKQVHQLVERMTNPTSTSRIQLAPLPKDLYNAHGCCLRFPKFDKACSQVMVSSTRKTGYNSPTEPWGI